MIALVARFKVRDGATFQAAAEEMVRAEAGRKLLTTSHRDQNDPAVYACNEQNADAGALAVHGKTEHMAAFGGAIQELLDDRPESLRLEPLAELGT